MGLIADSASLRLPKRLPYHIAMEMLLTGRRMGAEEALRWGLVNAVVPQVKLMDKARDDAQQIIQGAPLAVASVKELVSHSQHLSLERRLCPLTQSKT
ncbi:MAG: enoyl-CoA hydratase-related protein [Deinococcales bacterium]